MVFLLGCLLVYIVTNNKIKNKINNYLTGDNNKMFVQSIKSNSVGRFIDITITNPHNIQGNKQLKAFYTALFTCPEFLDFGNKKKRYLLQQLS